VSALIEPGEPAGSTKVVRPVPPIERPVVALTRPRLPGGVLERLEEWATLRRWPERRPPSPGELVELAKDAHGLLCLGTERIDRSFLRQCPSLVVVSTVSVGFDHLDLDALRAEGVAAGHTPGVLDEATADLAWALLLGAARRVAQADRFVREGRWDYPDLEIFVGPDFSGARLGIVGMGRIGRAVARRASGFGMEVVHHDPTPDEVPGSTWVTLEELLETSDFVSLHVPLTPSTERMIGEAELRRMKPTAVLVNTSRGQVIDQPALVRALSEGWIFGAGLDVAAVEPVQPGDDLLSLPNCTVLPHIGSASTGARRALAELAVANLTAALRAEPMPAPLVPLPGFPGPAGDGVAGGAAGGHSRTEEPEGHNA
jgi:glyoxylate reductase